MASSASAAVAEHWATDAVQKAEDLRAELAIERTHSATLHSVVAVSRETALTAEN